MEELSDQGISGSAEVGSIWPHSGGSYPYRPRLLDQRSLSWHSRGDYSAGFLDPYFPSDWMSAMQRKRNYARGGGRKRFQAILS